MAKSETSTLTHDLQSLGEEIANSLTHAIGILLGITAIVLLIVFTKESADAAWRITSFSIYGSALIFLYTVSTLYHSIAHGSVKRFLRKLDHAAIFILIAGTYTPVTLILMRHSWIGWAIFGTIWIMALMGIAMKFFCSKEWRKLSVVLYIFMGWLVVIASETLVTSAPVAFILWLLAGGISYTLAVVFYGWHRLPYHHTIFHVFVLMGSLAHFFGIFYYLT